jgi:hypothetical protein
MVSNRMFDSDAAAVLQFTSAVQRAFVFDPADGAFHPVSLGPLNSLSVDLAPGAAKLYRLRTGPR